MTDTKEIHGELFFKKKTIEFIEKLENILGESAIKKLKKLDPELFE